MNDSHLTKDVNKTPFILDTDMASDSWAAVLFAALHPMRQSYLNNLVF
jgi:hypothetical protein